MSKVNYILFLDDVRKPQEAFPYTKQRMFVDYQWEVVRNYDEFTKHITANGAPYLISFDHDLADEHYAPENVWNDYKKSEEWEKAQTFTEKTGYDCAKWLVEYCLDNNIACPKFYCHSMNPVGKTKILNLLESFQKQTQHVK